MIPRIKRSGLSALPGRVRVTDAWGIALSDTAIVRLGQEELKAFLEDSFGLKLNGKEAFLRAEIRKTEKRAFGFDVSATEICFWGEDAYTLRQAMVAFQWQAFRACAPAFEKKTYTFTPRYYPRLVTVDEASADEELVRDLIECGYHGVILDSPDVQEETIRLFRENGLLVYYKQYEEDQDVPAADGVIGDGFLPQNGAVRTVDLTSRPSAEEREKILATLPENVPVILSFEQGKAETRGEVTAVLSHGSLCASSPSDELYEAAENSKRPVWIADSAAGRTNEFGTVPYLPAMMQWLLRYRSLEELSGIGRIEADAYGFHPSVVSAFAYLQSFEESGDPGEDLQMLGQAFYGNAQEAMLAFKDVSDAVNHLLPHQADLSGPLYVGPAYPLLMQPCYDYPFAACDVTLSTDAFLEASLCFEKAAGRFDTMKGPAAEEGKYICLFASRVLVTVCNSQRWYRRFYAMSVDKTDYKVNFLRSQMIKIGENEMDNARGAGEVLMHCPLLMRNRFESVCSLDAIEAKLAMTQKSVQKLKNQTE